MNARFESVKVLEGIDIRHNQIIANLLFYDKCFISFSFKLKKEKKNQQIADLALLVARSTKLQNRSATKFILTANVFLSLSPKNHQICMCTDFAGDVQNRFSRLCWVWCALKTSVNFMWGGTCCSWKMLSFFFSLSRSNSLSIFSASESFINDIFRENTYSSAVLFGSF